MSEPCHLCSIYVFLPPTVCFSFLVDPFQIIFKYFPLRVSYNDFYHPFMHQNGHMWVFFSRKIFLCKFYISNDRILEFFLVKSDTISLFAHLSLRLSPILFIICITSNISIHILCWRFTEANTNNNNAEKKDEK